MFWILAKAEGADPTDSNLTIVVIAMVTAAVVCVVAAIPVATARRRRLNQTEGIAAIMVLWGLLTAGSVVYWANAQMKFSHEYTLRLMENLDPSDQSDRPNKPWLLWGFLAVGYGGTLLFSFTARTAIPHGFPLDVTSPPKDPTG
jgi:hypothetical protein